MCVVIVGAMLVASLAALAGVARNRPVQSERQAAMGLAQQLMSEILQCAFQDPQGGTAIGTDGDESTRAAYDDVDDYDRWESTTLTLKDGTPVAGFDGWKWKTRVDYVLYADPRTTTSGVTTLKRVRVIVTAPSGAEYILRGLRSKYGAYEKAPPEATNYLTWAGVRVRVGETGKTLPAGSHPLNVTSSQ